MSTPIYKISDRQPEFPCWLWHKHYRAWAFYEIGEGDSIHITHWCHSDTRPSVVPEELGAPLHDLVHRGPTAQTSFTQPSSDVAPQGDAIVRIAEEITAYLRRQFVEGYTFDQNHIADLRAQLAAAQEALERIAAYDAPDAHAMIQQARAAINAARKEVGRE